MISTQLFDKIIDIEFTLEKEKKPGGISFATLSAGGKNKTLDFSPGSKTIAFRTPRTGPKPNVSLFMESLPNANVSNIVLKITNFYSTINIALYKYMKIKAGYNNGPVIILDCEIRNCFIERPNPEGITVFEGVIGVISDMLNTTKSVKFVLNDDTVEAGIKKMALAAGLTPNIVLPKDWNGISFVGKNKSYPFTNALTMRTWLSDMLNTLARVNSISKLYVSVRSGLLKVYPIGQGSGEAPKIIIDKVSTAYLMGGHIIIKAPWNPMIMPDTEFKMDTRYFRGRMGSLQVGGEKKDFSIFKMSISFSTHDENSMDIEAIDLSTVGAI